MAAPARSLSLTRLLRVSQRMKRTALRIHTSALKSTWSGGDHFHPGDRPSIDLDWHRILDPENVDTIAEDVRRRKGVGDIRQVHQLHGRYLSAPAGQRAAALEALTAAAIRLPNRTRPGWLGEDMVAVRTVGEKPEFDFPLKDFRWRAEKLNMFRMDNLGLLTGSRTYYLKHGLAQMEAALVRFALSAVLRAGFHLVSVPDLLNSSVLEACGVPVHGERTMVYSLDERYHGDVCLSGTAEMALAALLAGRSLPPDQLPLRLAAVSRCFRPEVSNLESESGLYRVHQFTKVEMFGVCAGDEAESAALLQEFVAIQERIFTALGLHFIVYDMPPHELGAPAYSKYDIEAWMPGRGMYGEVSSASDCTDYQSRRLNIRDSYGRLLHTVNGTACAAPRALIAAVETHQQRDGSVAVPAPLQPLMAGLQRLTPQPGRAQWLRAHQLRVAGETDDHQAAER